MEAPGVSGHFQYRGSEGGTRFDRAAKTLSVFLSLSLYFYSLFLSLFLSFSVCIFLFPFCGFSIFCSHRWTVAGREVSPDIRWSCQALAVHSLVRKRASKFWDLKVLVATLKRTASQ